MDRTSTWESLSTATPLKQTEGGRGGPLFLPLSFNARVCVCVRAVVCVVCVRGVLRYLCLETSASAHACVYVRACVRVYVPFNSQ